jgi:hypothetical protein
MIKQKNMICFLEKIKIRKYLTYCHSIENFGLMLKKIQILDLKIDLFLFEGNIFDQLITYDICKDTKILSAYKTQVFIFSWNYKID